MPDPQKFSLGDDGELKLDWSGDKAKHGASLLWRMRSLVPALVLMQTLCIGVLCVSAGLLFLGGDLNQIRCKLLGTCPTPTPTRVTGVYSPRTDTPTPTAVDAYAIDPPGPTPTPTYVTDSACNADLLGRTEQKIAFVADRVTAFGSAFITPVNQMFVCRLLSNSDGVDTLAWSPDGQRLAFTSSRSLWVANRDGTGQQRLVTPVVGDEPISWSSDGNQILFVVEEARGGSAIFSIGADGSGKRQLTGGTAHDRWPRWSPDGRRILFTSDRGGATTGIFVMNSDGTNIVRVNDEVNGFHADWSTNGREIVFASDQAGDREIYRMNADGTDVTRLTTASGRDDFPRWSPDGWWIIFVSYRDGNDELYMMDTNGNDQTRLTHNLAVDTHPVWIP